MRLSSEFYIKLMDKVYAKLLSVSILLSLCGAGVMSPCGEVSAVILEALSSPGTCGGRSQDVNFEGVREAVSSPSRGFMALNRLKSFLSGITERLSSWKPNVGGDDNGHAPQFVDNEAICDACDDAFRFYERSSTHLFRLCEGIALRSQWQPLALKCRAGPAMNV